MAGIVLDKENIIEFISLMNGEQFAALKIFQNTSLRDTSYIKIRDLKEMLDYDSIGRSPFLYHWEITDEAKGTSSFGRMDADDRIPLMNLIEDCEEMQIFCREYGYSSYVI